MMSQTRHEKSVSGPQQSQLMCLVQRANCPFVNFLNLEKRSISDVFSMLKPVYTR